MATVSDYEDARYELIDAFHGALTTVRAEEAADRWGGKAHEDAVVGAFDAVDRLTTWDHMEDEDFMGWCLKATQQEILAEALSIALKRIKVG